MTDAIGRTRLRKRRHETPSHTSARHHIPDLSPLTELLAQSGQLRALVERYRKAAGGRVGRDLRHVTYAAMPHGAKTYLAAALAVASGERLVWIARDAEIADRVAEELGAWLGERRAGASPWSRARPWPTSARSWCAMSPPRAWPRWRHGTERARLRASSWPACRPSSSARSRRATSPPTPCGWPCARAWAWTAW